MVIEEIKKNLNENQNLTEEVKSDLYALISLLHKYYPDISLEILKERIKTLQFEAVGKFISDEAVLYNEYTNTLQINQNELEKTNNIKRILMVAVLYMIPAPGNDENNLMDGIKKGFAELVANSLVGSEEDE